MTRRSLARLLSSTALASAAPPAALLAQTPAAANDDANFVAAQMRAAADQLKQVKLPMATEPAFHFKA